MESGVRMAPIIPVPCNCSQTSLRSSSNSSFRTKTSFANSEDRSIAEDFARMSKEAMFGQAQSPRHLGLCLYLVRRYHQGRKERTRRLLGRRTSARTRWKTPLACGWRPKWRAGGALQSRKSHSPRHFCCAIDRRRVL